MYLTEEESLVVCRQLVHSLTPEEREIAARTSYQYWLAATNVDEPPPTNEHRLEMAMREAQRHTVGPHGYDRALSALKETCAFRKHRMIELFRTLFDDDRQYETEEEQELAEKYRLHIEEDVNKQNVVVRGMDRESRAIVLVFPRTCPELTDEDCFINTQLYMIERAIACTEALSDGKQDQIVVVLDFGDLKTSCAPPLNNTKKFIWILQNHYPQRLRNLIIVDAPLWMRGIYSLLSPFVDPYTKTKFRMVKGDKQKKEHIHDIVGNDQAMPFLLPNGELPVDIDMNHFVRNVPFSCLYDEFCCRSDGAI